MLISDKQHAANRANAKQSCGPKTPEGKDTSRRNALNWGFRARVLLMEPEDPAEYLHLWCQFLDEWQPQAQTELLQLEQMSTSQWLLARMALREVRVSASDLGMKSELQLLDMVARQRSRLERSFSSALRDLVQLQKFRQSRPQPQAAAPDQPAQPAQPAQTADPEKPAQPAPPPVPPPPAAPAPPPDYVMSQTPGPIPVSCAPAPGSR